MFAEIPDACQQAGKIAAEFYQQLDDRHVSPAIGKEQLHQFFDYSLDEQGKGLVATVEEFARDILPHCMGIPHPLYLGLLNSSSLPAAALADFFISLVNNNNGAFRQSPAMSVAEQEVIRSFIDKLRLPQNFSGIVVPGGTFANLQGLQLARTAHFPQWQKHGPTILEKTPVLYTSTAAHFSIARAAGVLGFGEANIRAIEVDDDGEMDVAALERQIARDIADNHHPFAVIATIGTTSTGAIDPIAAIVAICQQYQLWLHIDACYGAAAFLTDEFDDILSAAKNADSMALDPHKWFFIPITAALLLTPHREVERATFDVDAPYIPAENPLPPYLRGIPTSRRCSGFAVWMALRAHGWQTVRQAVESNIQLTRILEKLLRAEGFTVLENRVLSTVCARWQPDGYPTTKLGELQQTIASKTAATGKAWFATTRHMDQTWLRLCLVNLHTRERHIRDLVQLLVKIAKEASK